MLNFYLHKWNLPYTKNNFRPNTIISSGLQQKGLKLHKLNLLKIFTSRNLKNQYILIEHVFYQKGDVIVLSNDLGDKKDYIK